MVRYLLPTVLATVAAANCNAQVPVPELPVSVSVSASASVSASTSAPTTAPSADCDCWSSSSGVFNNRQRWDFTGKTQYVAVPDVPSDRDAAAAAVASSDYFSADEFTSAWRTQTWPREETDTTILMVNSRSNVYIAQDDADPSLTFLVLRTARHANGLQTAAELESVRSDYQFMSARMYARTVGADGACTAMFTYLNSNPVQEADIEFLTKEDRSTVHYTNQPSYIEGVDGEVEGSTQAVTMPVSMGDWAEHRLDWIDGSSEWFINGESVAQISVQAPSDPALFMFNSWSNGGSWTGLMAEGNQARLEIQWIEIAYNVSGGAGGSCSSVCSLD